MIYYALSLLDSYGVLFFLTIGVILCVGIQVSDFIDFITEENNDE